MNIILVFFLMTKQQKSINDSLQNFCILSEQVPLLDHVKEILLPELLEVKPPEYYSSEIAKKKQWEQLFMPSTSPVVHSSKLPNNMLPRLLEDEGFYIPRKPYVSRNTYHKMENRLLQQKGVFESSKKTTLLTKMYLPLPNSFLLKSKEVLDEAEFSCEQQVKPSDGAVGSNVLFFLDGNKREEFCPLMSGKLLYSLFWATDDRGIPLAPTVQPVHVACNNVPRNVDAGKGTRIWWHSDIQKLIAWAKEVNIDPNDPNYSDLIELIMFAKSQEQSDSKYFRLEQLQEEFNFVTEEEIKSCKRFQLLQLRSLGQLGFYRFQQIPLCDREIPDTVFQEYGSQLEKDKWMTAMDPISAQRNCSASFIREMRELVMKRIMTIRHKFNLSDIVNDYEEIISMRLGKLGQPTFLFTSLFTVAASAQSPLSRFLPCLLHHSLHPDLEQQQQQS
ncbi:hypothetical protein lerEdw1_007728 [Lerista edwardsae]|nr:hypothetical protein lerEdw1_007728 [Lerista edwardsae]